MSRHFCCCIPVRVAVFIASLVAFLLSGAVSGLAIYLIIRINDPQAGLSLVTTKEKTAIEVAAGVFGFVSLCSLFGFIGSVIRSRGLVAIYVYMSYLIFFLELISVTYGSISLFEKVPGSEKGICNVEIDGKPADCLELSNGLKAALIGLAVIILIIQLYVVVVIRRYLQQLEEEQSYDRSSKYAMGTVPIASAPSNYYPHTPMQNQGGYSYANPQNSFGSHA